MKRYVAHKLFLAILLATVLAVFGSMLIMQWSLKHGFLRFIHSIEKEGLPRLAAALEDEYRKTSSWDRLTDSPSRWFHLIATTLPGGNPSLREMPEVPPPGISPMSPPGLLPPHLTHQFDRRLFLQDADGKIIAGQHLTSENVDVFSLHDRGKPIGFLGLLPVNDVSDSSYQRFLSEQRSAFVLVAVVIVMLSAMLSLMLARRLVRPITLLADATRQLASGAYHVRVSYTSEDELGRLASDFNLLAQSLEHNETARRLWVADISHELRTPLTFLRSQVEAIIDGVRQPNGLSMQTIHKEILRLTRLVEDLYQLSLSDVGAQTYRKDAMDIVILLSEILDAYRLEFSTKEITVFEKIDTDHEIWLFADSARLHQLFSNLLENALKYTEIGGTVEIGVFRDGGQVVVDIQDSAPGVSTAELGRLFERLYRVEPSRNRSTGGAGLGLTICRAIVDAHDGCITAKHSHSGGVWIRVELPCKGKYR